MSTKSTRGFTLVELIVVITILVILGTIAFMNMWSFSASARDSQRTSDLNQINTQIMTIQAKQGMSYTSMLSGTVANKLTTISIGGTWAVGTEYAAGDVNYTALGVDSTKFDDPTKSVAYKMGATTLAGTAYELAASLEETNKALVMGVYRSRAAATVTGTTVDDVVTIATTDIGKLRIGDTITTAGVIVTTTIKTISADGLRITLATTAADGATSLALANSETGGLISWVDTTWATTDTPVTNDGTVLPYAIQ